jgi:uncharacterized protein YfaP (DUF2135 family)
MIRSLKSLAALAMVAALFAGCGTDSGTGGTNPPVATGSAHGTVVLDASGTTGATATGSVTVIIGDQRLVIPVDVTFLTARTITVTYDFPVVAVGRTGVLYLGTIVIGDVTYSYAGYTTVAVVEGETTTIAATVYQPVTIDTSFTPTGNVQFSGLSVPSTSVSSPYITLTGTVSNMDVQQIFVYVNGDVFPVSLNLSGGTGAFTAMVSLDPGLNVIVVAAMNSNGVLVLSDPITVTYTSTIAGNTMLGTLIWDSPTSDIDLHLWYYTETSPSSTSTYSQHCYFSSKDLTGIRPDEATDAAGNLDVDDQEGYGPEHMTLIGYPDGYYVLALDRYSMDQDLTSNCNFTLKVGSAERTTACTFSTTSVRWYRCYDVRVVGGVASILSPNTSLAVGLGKTILPKKVAK